MKKAAKHPPRLLFRHYEGINHTPALPLLVEAQREMMSSGFMVNETVGSWDNWAIVAFMGLVPVGLIAYENVKWRKIVWISLSYVVPKYRRRGIHTRLFKELRKKALTLEGAPREIQGGVSAKNTVMQSAAIAQGRQATFTVYSLTLRGDA